MRKGDAVALIYRYYGVRRVVRRVVESARGGVVVLSGSPIRWNRCGRMIGNEFGKERIEPWTSEHEWEMSVQDKCRVIDVLRGLLSVYDQQGGRVCLERTNAEWMIREWDKAHPK